MADFRSSSVIFRQIEFDLVEVLSNYHSHCEIDNSSFARRCSLVSFFYENHITNLSHNSFGVLSSQMCYSISSTIVVFKVDIALPSLIFHLRKAPLESFFDGVVSLPPMTSQRICPCK